MNFLGAGCSWRDSYCVTCEILQLGFWDASEWRRGGGCVNLKALSGPRAAAFLPSCPHMTHSVSENGMLSAFGTSFSFSAEEEKGRAALAIRRTLQMMRT